MPPRYRAPLFALPLVVLAALPLTAAAPPVVVVAEQETAVAPTESLAEAKALVRRIHAAVNTARRAEGLAPLTFDPALALVADRHSHDMAARGFFGHATPEGDRTRDRFERAAYPFRRLAENLYRGAAYARAIRVRHPDQAASVHYEWRDTDAQAAHIVREWLSSPGHRDNLLGPEYERHGIGVAPGPNHTWYVTQNLVRRPTQPAPALASAR